MKVNFKKIVTFLCVGLFSCALLLTLNNTSVHADSTASRGFNVPVTWNEGDSKVTLPSAPDGWDIELFGSDRKEVVALDGTVTRPLQDVTVKLLYKLTNKTTHEVIETNVNSQIRITKKLPDSFTSGSNEKPKVLPVLREWAGGDGTIKIKNGTRIIIDSANYREGDAEHVKANLAKEDNFYSQVQSFQSDLKDLMGVDAPIVVDGAPKSGDIYFTSKKAPTTLGKEGYQIEIGEIGTANNIVTVRAHQKTGALYGGVSILQILKQNDGNLPKGITRDYPEFEKRGYMLDVARTFLPLDYLNTTMKQMSWYKLNTFSLHLSDNDIWNNLTLGNDLYAAFRLQSDVKGLTAKDGYYTKDEFRELQYDGNDLGVAVIPELDTPGHALAYTRVWPDISRKDSGKYLDVKNPETVKRIMGLFDEYTKPQNDKEEVFVLPEVNIGTDEYKNGDKEAFRTYTDTLLKHIKASGKEPVFWGSLTENHGTTPVMSDATMFAWYKGYANAKQSLDAGYRVISMEDMEVYIVPGGGYYNNQYGRGEYLYNSWLPNKNDGWAGSPAPEGHPRAVGGQFAVWNDWVGNGISTGDISFRIQYDMQAIAQKSWAGTENDGQNYNQFKALGKTLGDAPNADFLYTDQTYKDDKMVDLKSMDDIQTNTGANLSSHNVSSATGRFDEGIRFNGSDSYINTNVESTGFDWTMAMWINPDSDNPKDAVLMEGKTGTLKLKQGDTNKLGYSVDHLFDEKGKPTKDKFNHYFDYDIPSDQWTHIALSGDAYGVKLYVNGMFVDELKDKKWPNYNEHSGQNSISGIPHYYETLMLPTATIGSKTNSFKGIVDDFQVYNRVLNASEIAQLSKIPDIQPVNLALGATVTASGNEVNDGRWTQDKVVDGDRTSNASRWSSNYDDNAWLKIDLGELKTISQIDIYWEAAYAAAYKIQVSTDGNTWTDVKSVTSGGKGGSPESIVFAPKDVRYIKFQGNKRISIGGWTGGYSIYEIEAFASPKTKADLIQLLTTSTTLYNNTSMYLDDASKNTMSNLLKEVNDALITDMTNDQITEYKTKLTSQNTSLNAIKKAKDAMIKARDTLRDYAAEPANKRLLSQDTLDKVTTMLARVDKNLEDKVNAVDTDKLTTDINDLLQVAKDEVMNANIAKNATVTTNKELWSGFPLGNLVDGDLNTRLAYKRTADPIQIDIKLSDAQKSKPWNQMILHEVVGTIEDGEVVAAEIAAYDVQIKQPDGTYTSVQKVERNAGNTAVCGSELTIDLDKKVTTDAVRLIVTPRSANAGLNISEFEIYNTNAPSEDDHDIRGILYSLQMPAVEETDKIALPSAPEGYEVTLVQTNAPAIVALNGDLTLPENDSNVRVVLELSKKKDGNVTQRATKPFTMQIPKKPTDKEKEALTTIVNECKTLHKDDYAVAGWQTLQNAIRDAEEALAKKNVFATSVAKASQQVTNAKGALVNISELNKRIAAFEALDANDYMSDSYQAYKALIQEKQALLTKEDVTAQEITDACTALDDFHLVIKGDLQALQSLVDKLEADSNLVEKNYSKNSWSTYATALAEAKALLQLDECPKDVLSEKQTALNNAHTNLVSLMEAKKTLAEYADKELDTFTPKSKLEFTNAIHELEQNIAKADVTKGELANAITSVLHANANLVVGADMQQLSKLVETGKDYVKNEKLYTKASYDAFDKAYQVIVKMASNENTSKTDADAAIQALNNAILGLIKEISLEQGGVIIHTDDSTIPYDSVLHVKTPEDKVIESVKAVLADIGKKVKVYDITLMSANAPVVPQKDIEVKIAIPENFDQSKLALYYVNGNHREKLAFTIEDGYIKFMTNHFSIYTIVEKDSTTSTPIDPDKPGDTSTSKPSTNGNADSNGNVNTNGNANGTVGTGDRTDLSTYIMGFFVAFAAMILIMIRRSKFVFKK